MLPSVDFTFSDGNTGVVRPSDTGVGAIIAPCQSGTQNQAGGWTRPDLVLTNFGYGPLTVDATYVMQTAKNPVVLVRTSPSTAGAYSSFTTTGGGTSVISAGGTAPLDEFNVLITFITGGTIGVTGIQYTYSLDGGVTTSAVLALGTAVSFVIPNTGITVDLATGTILANETVAFTTTAPVTTDSDLPTSLEALRQSALPWEILYFEGISEATTVGLIDTWLTGIQSEGKFKAAIINCRPRNSGETEASYLTALTTIFAAAASKNIVVCADVGEYASPLWGVNQPRPAALAIFARAMSVDAGHDVAYVDDGPVAGGFAIADSRGNPLHHDEAKFPGLDSIRLATLRSLNGRQGTYITNAPMISSSGSDWVYLQHSRVMNKGAELAWQLLTGQLSRGVNKNPKVGPNGERYIAEDDAQRIEGLVNAALEQQLVSTGQVADMKLLLSRTDNIASNQGATITCQLQSVALGYIKVFSVTAKFVTAIG